MKDYILAHPRLFICAAVVIAVAAIVWLIIWRLNVENHRSRASLARVYAEGLVHLRNQEPGYSQVGRNILAAIEEGKFRFEDIGAAEEELHRLWFRLYHKEKALECLELARRASCDWEAMKPVFDEHLGNSMATLEQLGASESELSGFPRAIAVFRAKRLWSEALASHVAAQVGFERLDSLMESSGLATADIGVPEEEYAKMMPTTHWLS